MDRREPVGRIHELHIRDLRGFAGQHRLDLNADLVLVTGANGSGKSSLLHVLSLVANGASDERVRAQWTFGEQKQGWIEAVGRDTAGGPWRARAEFKGRRFEVAPAPPGPGLARLRCVATAFLQDDAEEYLSDRDGNSPSVLRELLAPSDIWRERLQAPLEAAHDRLEQERRRWAVTGSEPAEAIERDRNAAAARVQDVWNAWRATQPGLGPVPKFDYVLESGNLSARLRGQIIRRCGHLATQLGDEHAAPGHGAPLEEWLSRLLELLRTAAKREADRRADELEAEDASTSPPPPAAEDFDILPSDARLWLVGSHRLVAHGALPRDVLVVPLDDVGDELVETRLGELRDSERALRDALGLLVANQKRFDGPQLGLSSILAALDEAGSRWAAEGAVVPMGLPEALRAAWPHDVARWLADSLAAMEAFHPPLRAQLDAWNDAVQRRLAEATSAREALNRRIHAQEDARSLAGALRDAGCLPAADACAPGDDEWTVDRLRRAVAEAAGNGGVPTTSDEPLAPTIRALDDWLAVERRDAVRQRTVAANPGAAAARDVLDRALEALSAELDDQGLLAEAATTPHAELCHVGDLVDRIFRDFALGEGFEGLRFGPAAGQRRRQRSWGFSLAPPLRIDSLSTGQRSLLALATTLTLNLLVKLPHRLVLLDDFTTSLDMSQLPIAARLVRGLAYGSGLDGDEPRRQVILTSHHEDLTNRLLDYLLPPAGRSMRVLNFVDWRPDSGPRVESYDVDPAPPRPASHADTLRGLIDDGLRGLAVHFPGAPLPRAAPARR